jgi:diguanylate cyclase (GGDEF)-like protein
MSIGVEREPLPLVRHFMAVCLRRLSIRRIHLYIAPNDDALPDKLRQAYLTGMPKGQVAPPHQDRRLESRISDCLRDSCAKGDVLVFRHETIYFHVFPLKNRGALILERQHSAMPQEVISTLIPAFDHLYAGYKAARQHERILLEVERRRQAEARIEYQVYHDDLTGLPNRLSFLARLAQVIRQAAQNGSFCALLYLDLDNFKDVNDSLGHSLGDALLQQAGERLRARLSDDMTMVSRLGSDEFGVLRAQLGADMEHARRQAVELARQIQYELSKPVEAIGKSLYVSTSIGIVVFPNDAQAAEKVLQQGDTAMYRAKNLGRNTLHFYEAGMEAEAKQRLMLDADMRQALEQNQFELHFQPQVNFSGTICGMESLIRWRHPQRGLVSPAAFIPMAEKSGLIVAIGEWVLQRACALSVRLPENSPLNTCIAVNLSAKQFHQADFVARVQSLLRHCGADGARLEFELTESTLLDNAEQTIQKMHQLKELGIRFSIDDFGTGYSSLTYLKRLPIDRIKIDKSFVQNVDSSADDAAIVETILAMAEHFGLSVIAEGVETVEEWRFLQALGCRAFQGYYFYRPMPLDELLYRLSLQAPPSSCAASAP